MKANATNAINNATSQSALITCRPKEKYATAAAAINTTSRRFPVRTCRFCSALTACCARLRRLVYSIEACVGAFSGIGGVAVNVPLQEAAQADAGRRGPECLPEGHSKWRV